MRTASHPPHPLHPILPTIGAVALLGVLSPQVWSLDVIGLDPFIREPAVKVYESTTRTITAWRVPMTVNEVIVIPDSSSASPPAEVLRQHPTWRLSDTLGRTLGGRTVRAYLLTVGSDEPIAACASILNQTSDVYAIPNLLEHEVAVFQEEEFPAPSANSGGVAVADLLPVGMEGFNHSAATYGRLQRLGAARWRDRSPLLIYEAVENLPFQPLHPDPPVNGWGVGNGDQHGYICASTATSRGTGNIIDARFLEQAPPAGLERTWRGMAPGWPYRMEYASLRRNLWGQLKSLADAASECGVVSYSRGNWTYVHHGVMVLIDAAGVEHLDQRMQNPDVPREELPTLVASVQLSRWVASGMAALCSQGGVILVHGEPNNNYTADNEMLPIGLPASIRTAGRRALEASLLVSTANQTPTGRIASHGAIVDLVAEGLVHVADINAGKLIPKVHGTSYAIPPVAAAAAATRSALRQIGQPGTIQQVKSWLRATADINQFDERIVNLPRALDRVANLFKNSADGFAGVWQYDDDRREARVVTMDQAILGEATWMSPWGQTVSSSCRIDARMKEITFIRDNWATGASTASRRFSRSVWRLSGDRLSQVPNTRIDAGDAEGTIQAITLPDLRAMLRRDIETLVPGPASLTGNWSDGARWSDQIGDASDPQVDIRALAVAEDRAGNLLFRIHTRAPAKLGANASVNLKLQCADQSVWTIVVRNASPSVLYNAPGSTSATSVGGAAVTARIQSTMITVQVPLAIMKLAGLPQANHDVIEAWATTTTDTANAADVSPSRLIRVGDIGGAPVDTPVAIPFGPAITVDGVGGEWATVPVSDTNTQPTTGPNGATEVRELRVCRSATALYALVTMKGPIELLKDISPELHPRLAFMARYSPDDTGSGGNDDNYHVELVANVSIDPVFYHITHGSGTSIPLADAGVEIAYSGATYEVKIPFAAMPAAATKNLKLYAIAYGISNDGSVTNWSHVGENCWYAAP